MRTLRSSRSTSVTTNSKPRWMTPHLGFSTKALGQNGINATAVPPFRRFRSDAFQAQTRPQVLISFPPNPEHGALHFSFTIFVSWCYIHTPCKKPCKPLPPQARKTGAGNVGFRLVSRLVLPAGNCEFEEVWQAYKRPNVCMVKVLLSEKKKCLSRHWAVVIL